MNNLPITGNVFRDASLNCDCTRNGVSAKHTRLTVRYVTQIGSVGPSDAADVRACRVIAAKLATDGESAVVLVRRMLGGERCDVVVPLAAFVSGQWTMMGGNFLYSCDSRFRALSPNMPLPIHDRIET